MAASKIQVHNCRHRHLRLLKTAPILAIHRFKLGLKRKLPIGAGKFPRPFNSMTTALLPGSMSMCRFKRFSTVQQGAGSLTLAYIERLHTGVRFVVKVLSPGATTRLIRLPSSSRLFRYLLLPNNNRLNPVKLSVSVPR